MLQYLKIGIVKALANLFRIGEIESSTCNYVINMIFSGIIIVYIKSLISVLVSRLLKMEHKEKNWQMRHAPER